jgi:hypothetical protein
MTPIVVILVNGRILLDAMIAVICAVTRLAVVAPFHNPPKNPKPE